MQKKITIPGPSVSFVELLDAAINTDQAKEKENEFFPLRPSSAGHCARKLAYDLNEFYGNAKYKKDPMDPSVVRLLSLGHGVEFSVFRHFDLCKEFKVRYKQQVVTLFRLDPIDGSNDMERMVEGSIDAVFVAPEWSAVVDIKSAKDKFSAAYQSKWDETLALYDSLQSLEKISDNGWWAENLSEFLNEVNDVFLADNFLQLNAYLYSSFCVERNIEFGSIIKYCKNDSRMYEIRFRKSPELFEYVRNKYNAVNYVIRKYKEPERITKEYVLGSMRCAFCQYKSTCWEEDALKAYFKTFPKKQWPTDTDRMGESGQELERLLFIYQEFERLDKKRDTIEQAVVKIMLEEKVDKIKLANKDVYMIKSLKDGIVLRRTKL